MVNWEKIEQNQAGTLYRLKVPNGWLVKEVQETSLVLEPRVIEQGFSWTSSICFIPDATHSWLKENSYSERKEIKLKDLS